MPPVKQLTDRDKKLLECLMKCGTVTSEQAGVIYNVAGYHYRRLKKLEERGYIKRHGKYIEILQAGAAIIGAGKSAIKIKKEQERKYRSMVAEVYIKLQGWNYLSSREIKKQRNMNMSSLVSGYIEKGGKGYAFYVLSHEPKKSTVQTIKHELQDLYLFNIDRAILFCPSPKAMEHFNGNNAKLKELLLLPFPFGVELLNRREGIEEAIKGALPGFKKSNRPFADYENGREYVSVMIFNDLAKKEHLENYIKYAKEKEGRGVKIICLDDQSEKIAAQFPGVEQIKLQLRGC